MGMEAGLDTGPMFAHVETPIAGKTGAALMAELAEAGGRLLATVLDDLPAYPPVPQPAEGVTYAAKIDKSETHVDFLVSAVQVERQIRAFSPLAFFELAGERIRVLSAEIASPAEFPAGGDVGVVLDARLSIACNPGVIRPLRVQRAGKGVMTTAELLRGFPIPPGTKLT
jgi:methionyl-tRNA formyltransferase